MEEELNQILNKLLAVRKMPIGTSAGLTKEQVIFLCDTVLPIYNSQPVLLELKPPITICGDIHAQYHDLLRIFEIAKYPPETNFLFLGDYVDRGKNNIETISLLFVFKIMYPNNFFMLRGNHECTYINRLYGFYEECQKTYDIDLWRRISEVFKYLPIAAIIEDKIFCIHGGISPDLHTLDDIRNLKRPQEIPEEGLLCDLLWSDPSPDAETWEENERGTSYCFGVELTEQFLQKFDFDLLCRAHQAVMNGYEFPFQGNQCCITLFSAPNYCYEFENKGAILQVHENLFCSCTQIEPNNWEEDYYIGPRPGTPPRNGSDEDQSSLSNFTVE